MANFKDVLDLFGHEETKEKDGTVFHASKIVADREGVQVEYEACLGCTLEKKVEKEKSGGVFDITSGEKIGSANNLPDDMPSHLKDLISALFNFKKKEDEQEGAGETKH